MTEFVGFLAAYRSAGWGVGLLGALMTLWVTFIPCFLWIFVGAPYINWISSQPRLRAALPGITAAVVGIILNLSIWFALRMIFGNVTATHYSILTLWKPDIMSLDLQVLVLSMLSAVLMFRLRGPVLKVLVVSSIAGVLLSLV